MQQLWDQILQLLAQIITPDWGSVIALLPLGLLLLVALYFVWVIVRFATAGPQQRGKARITPIPPPGTHMPGPSFAPVIAALGAAALFGALVAGGIWLIGGLSVLVLALLYWGREALVDYDHLVGAERGPEVTHGPPPSGVHVPGPSWRPFLAGVAVAVVLTGLVFGVAILIAGVLMLIVTLLGWLSDARAEYRAVLEADRTGHLVNPETRFPKGTLVAFVVLLAFGAAFNLGLVPPKTTSAGTATGSPAPGASGAPASQAPGPSAPAGDITIEAHNIAFTTRDVSAPAGKPFTIAFVNQDANVPHNVSIHKDSPSGEPVFKGAIFPGPDAKVYEVPALGAGTYGFVCDVHPTMTGTLTVK